MPETLSYSSGRTAPGYGLLKLALALGVFPMACGISIALLFVATEWEWLKAAGFVCTMGGCLLVLIAMGLLLAYASQHARFGLRSGWSVLRDMVLVLRVFGLNAPAVLLCVALVRPVTRRYELTVTNGLSVMADQVDITVSPFPIASIGPLAPGASVKRIWYLYNDHQVTVRTRVGDATGETMIDTYVDPNMGPYKRFWTVTPAATQPSDASLR